MRAPDPFTIKFLLQLSETEPVLLREAQTKAMELSGADLSTAKRVSGRMAREGYVSNKKVGRSYTSQLTPEGAHYLTGLLADPEPEAGDPIIDERGLHLVNRVERKDWSALMRSTKHLNLKTAFVPASAKKVVVILEDGSKHVVPTH